MVILTIMISIMISDGHQQTIIILRKCAKKCSLPFILNLHHHDGKHGHCGYYIEFTLRTSRFGRVARVAELMMVMIMVMTVVIWSSC